MKNNIGMSMHKTWLYTIQLVILSLIILLSQSGFAKDRIQYHVQNFDGSTLKVINEQGIVSQSYQYAPFGQQLQLRKPSNQKNPNAFVGGVQDAGDLVYLKQRHYNPVLGRFYQPDPITFISGGHGQTNRYQYGWNDSYTFSDPSGATVTEAFGGLLAETWYAATGQPYDYSNLKGALFNGYNGTGWELTTSFLSDCLNFCTLGAGGAAVNGIKLGINEAKAFVVSSKFAMPEFKFANFASKTKLDEHYLKHGKEFGSKSAEEYLGLGQSIMNDGYKAEYLYKGELRTGYIQYMGNSSKNQVAKFAFVGTNSKGFITTIHTESGKSFWKMLNGNSSDKIIRGK